MSSVNRWLLSLPVAACWIAACGDDPMVIPAPPTGASVATTDAATSGPITTTGVGGAGGASTVGPGGGGSAPDCTGATAVPGERTYNIDFDGNTREYDVQIPISYDGATALPLVFDLHGYTSNKDQQKAVSGFADLAEDEGFVVVRPNGFGGLRSWNAGDFCCGQAQNQGLDDVGLILAIIDEVAATTCIDPQRIYATGISNGGALSHRLACEAADVFAAVAPVAYPIDRDPFDQCAPSRPIAVMHSHGRADIIVPYDGSLTQPSTPESFAYWAATNGCMGDPTITYQNDDSSCATYQTCDGGVATSLCTIDGGHLLYVNNDDVPVAELSWQFLSQYVLP